MAFHLDTWLLSYDILKILVMLAHGIIIRTGITCKEIPLEKSFEFAIPLKWSATHYLQKL